MFVGFILFFEELFWNAEDVPLLFGNIYKGLLNEKNMLMLSRVNVINTRVAG